MDTFTKKEQIVILVIVLAIAFVMGFKFIIKDMITAKSEPIGLVSDFNNDISPILQTNTELKEDEKVIIMVHVSGQVFSPGLVRLFEGDRVIDAVDLAGGLKSEADIDRINLAKKLVDEEKIHIPKIGEEIKVDITYDSQTTTKTSSKININQCSSSELETLPGIGKVTAGKIIDYRNSNPFKTIDELKNVSGIGEKKFEAVKHLITVK